MSDNQLTPVQALKGSIKQMEQQFAQSLPKHIKPEKFVRVVMTAIGNNPDLCDLERNSFFASCLKAAQDGLLPDGKEAAIVPFGGKAQYMPMIAGILKKVRNSGELATITAQVIYKNDKFEYWIDMRGEQLKHHPEIFGDRGDPIGVYAQALTKDGGVYIEILTMDQIKAIQSMSKGKNTPWNGPFKTEMWKKSALRRLSKRLPMSTDLESTIQADDNMYDLNAETTVAAEPAAANPTAPNKLNNIVNHAENANGQPETIDIKATSTSSQEPAAPSQSISDEVLPI